MVEVKIKREDYEMIEMAKAICEQLGGGGRSEWHEHAGIEQLIYSYNKMNFDISLTSPSHFRPGDEFEIKYEGTLVFDRNIRREGTWAQQFELLYKQAHAKLTLENEQLKQKYGMTAWALPIYGSLPIPLDSKKEEKTE